MWIRPRASRRNPLTWATFKMLLSQRMLVGIYIGQFCINALTTFFLTWFPTYLVKARHMSILQAGFAAALPALCGFLAGFWAVCVPTGFCARAIR
jgi:ACS family glucarate transporter-like MFS transporter